MTKIQRRKLSELDTVIDEMLARNPEWQVQLTKLVEAKLAEVAADEGSKEKLP